MRLDRLRGKRSRRYRSTTQADGTPPAPNRLQRAFQVCALNRVWASDVTACVTAEGWLYLAVVLDLASRRVHIVGSTPHPDEAFMGQVARTLTAADDGLLVTAR